MSKKGIERSTDRPTSDGSLAEQILRLTERVAALEAALGRNAGSSVPTESDTGAPVTKETHEEPAELSEEIVLVLSAAIAAYFGKRAHLRQARLVGAAGWAREGRVTIQASHHSAMGARQGATK